MLTIKLAFLLLISYRIFLCSLTLSNTSSFLTWSVQIIFSFSSTGYMEEFSYKSAVNASYQMQWFGLYQASADKWITAALFWFIMQRIRGGADKRLAQSGRKQATAIKLVIYWTYSPRSSIHFLVRCSNFCKTLKKKWDVCPSNQVSAAAMTSASDEKWRNLNCFFSPENRW